MGFCDEPCVPRAMQDARRPMGDARPRVSPQRQCANTPGWRLATSAMNPRARLSWRRKRLYVRMAHLTSVSPSV
jgi:hypothetical protein